MKPVTLVGCSILRKEVEMLIEKNHWPVRCRFACSSLHVDFGKLRSRLEENLTRYRAENPLVLYGSCHPQMEEILRQNGTRRTRGQNCIEMLLGAERFQQELMQGAFFLLEEWAQTWEHVVQLGMGSNRALWREIFTDQHKYILALRTPCSGDFTAEADRFSTAIGLPLRWTDVGIEHLEEVLRSLLSEEEA